MTRAASFSSPCRSNATADAARTKTPSAAGSLRTGVSWTLVSRVVYAGCQWAIVPVIARLGTPSQVGEYVLGMAISGPIIVFANLELRSSQATDMRDARPFGDYLALRRITATAAFLLIGVTARMFGGTAAAVATIIACGAARAVESLSDVYFGLLQRHESLVSIARSLLVKGPLGLLAASIGFVLTGSVAVACGALAVAWLIVLVVGDIPAAGRYLALSNQSATDAAPAAARFPRAWRPFAALAWDSLPLGLATGLTTLCWSLPRLVVEVELGRDQLGVFGAIIALVLAGQTVVQSIAFAVVPRLARLHAEGDRGAFVRLTRRLAGIGCGLALVVAAVVTLVGGAILGFFYGAEYAVHERLFLLTAVGASLQYVAYLLAAALQALRRFRMLLAVQIVNFTATAAFSFGFARLFGLNGVGGAMIAAAMIQLALVAGGVAWSCRETDEWRDANTFVKNGLARPDSTSTGDRSCAA